jgi:hypothetical protein
VLEKDLAIARVFSEKEKQTLQYYRKNFSAQLHYNDFG